MARKPSIHPTELEFQVLKVLWKNGPLSVREVRENLISDENRDLAHTSVITVLNTMAKKNYLKRKPRANAYIFETKVDRTDVSGGILKDVMDRIFDGSAVSMMLHLLEDEKVSNQEHDELKKLIKQHSLKNRKASK